jgi:hypothetical protein
MGWYVESGWAVVREAKKPAPLNIQITLTPNRGDGDKKSLKG